MCDLYVVIPSKGHVFKELFPFLANQELQSQTSWWIFPNRSCISVDIIAYFSGSRVYPTVLAQNPAFFLECAMSGCYPCAPWLQPSMLGTCSLLLQSGLFYILHHRETLLYFFNTLSLCKACFSWFFTCPRSGFHCPICLKYIPPRMHQSVICLRKFFFKLCLFWHCLWQTFSKKN